MGSLRLPSRYLWLGVALFLFLHSERTMACHTICKPVFWPECMGCGFTMFSESLCVRRSCGECEEDSCGVALPSQVDQWAADADSKATCSWPTEPVATVRIVRVQRLATRG